MVMKVKIAAAAGTVLMTILGFNLGIADRVIDDCGGRAKLKTAELENIRSQSEIVRQKVELYVASDARDNGAFEAYRKIEKEFLLPVLGSDPKIDEARIQFHCEAHFFLYGKRNGISQCSDKQGDLRKAGDQLKAAVTAYVARQGGSESQLRADCIRERLGILRYFCVTCW